MIIIEGVLDKLVEDTFFQFEIEKAVTLFKETFNWIFLGIFIIVMKNQNSLERKTRKTFCYLANYLHSTVNRNLQS